MGNSGFTYHTKKHVAPKFHQKSSLTISISKISQILSNLKGQVKCRFFNKCLFGMHEVCPKIHDTNQQPLLWKSNYEAWCVHRTILM